MKQQIPPHILALFPRDRLVDLLGKMAPLVNMEIDPNRISEVTREDLLMDLSWIINEVGPSAFVEVVMSNKEPVIH